MNPPEPFTAPTEERQELVRELHGQHSVDLAAGLRYVLKDIEAGDIGFNDLDGVLHHINQAAKLNNLLRWHGEKLATRES